MRLIIDLYIANLKYQFKLNSTRFALENLGRIMVWALIFVIYWAAANAFPILEQATGISAARALWWLCGMEILQRMFLQNIFFPTRIFNISLSKGSLALYYILASICSPFSLLIPIFAASTYGQVAEPTFMIIWMVIAVLFNSLVFLFGSLNFRGTKKILFFLSVLLVMALFAYGTQNVMLNQRIETASLLTAGVILILLYVALFQRLKKIITYRTIDRRSATSRRFSGEGWLWQEWKLFIRNKRFNTLIYLPILAAICLPVMYLFTDYQAAEGSLMLLSFAVAGGFILTYWLSFPGWDSTYYKLLMIAPKVFAEQIQKKYLFSLLISSIPVSLQMILFAFIDFNIVLQIATAFLLSASLLFYVLLLNAAHNDQRIELDESGFFNQRGLKLRYYGFVLLIVFGLQFWGSYKVNFAEVSLRYIWWGTILFSSMSLFFIKPMIRYGAKRIINQKYHLIRSYHDKNQ